MSTVTISHWCQCTVQILAANKDQHPVHHSWYNITCKTLKTHFHHDCWAPCDLSDVIMSLWGDTAEWCAAVGGSLHKKKHVYWHCFKHSGMYSVLVLLWKRHQNRTTLTLKHVCLLQTSLLQSVSWVTVSTHLLISHWEVMMMMMMIIRCGSLSPGK